MRLVLKLSFVTLLVLLGVSSTSERVVAEDLDCDSCVVADCMLPTGLESVPTGDSIFGRVTAVRRADLVLFAHAAGEYNLRIVGITVPTEARASAAATEFVRGLVFERNTRMRFEGRTRSGEMRARLFTTDTTIGIRDVSVELVRAGLVRKQANYDFKYGELAAAEREARAARRGLWTVPR